MLLLPPQGPVEPAILEPELPHRRLFSRLIDALGLTIRPIDELHGKLYFGYVCHKTGTIYLSYADFEGDPRLLGSILAHEIGHWTGLSFHLDRPVFRPAWRNDINMRAAEEWLADNVAMSIALYTGIPIKGELTLGHMHMHKDLAAPSTRKKFDTVYKRQIEEACLFISTRIEGKKLYDLAE